jgi:hypothetical protein
MRLYDTLESLDRAEQYLTPGLSFLTLDAIALRRSDHEAAAQ